MGKMDRLDENVGGDRVQSTLRTFSIKSEEKDIDSFKEIAKTFDSHGNAFGHIVSLGLAEMRRKKVGTEAFKPLIDAWSALCNQQLTIISTASGLYESAVIKAKENVQDEMERLRTAYDARVAELNKTAEKLKNEEDTLELLTQCNNQMKQEIDALQERIKKREEDYTFLKTQLETANTTIANMTKNASVKQVAEDGNVVSSRKAVGDEDALDDDGDLFEEEEVSENEN